MRGHVTKRGTTWSVVVELGPDPVTGKRRQRWHSGFKTRKAAEQARIALLGTVDSGTYIERAHQSLDEFITEWLAAIAPTVRPATHSSYTRNMRLHVTTHIGALKLSAVDGGTLNGLYADLLASGRRDHAGGGLSPRSVRYVHTILHRAFKDAVKWGRLARNPADAADPPTSKGVGSESTTWTATQLASFLTLSDESDDRYFPAWLMLASTGMRRGETLGLRWGDVDLEHGRAAIRQTVIVVDGNVMFGTPKTAKGRRSVAIDARTVAALRRHRQTQLEERMLLGAGWRDHDLIFTKVDGSPIHPERFSREFARRIERWALPHIRLHDLRHGWATMALSAGIHPRVVQERLGHANVSITLDTYSHVAASLHDAASEQIAALFAR